MRYRIALNGFSEFEYRAMQFSFQHRTTPQESEYEIVEALAKSDFSVVDADSELAVKMVVSSGRIDRTIFVGSLAPSGATWHFQRPIDPNRILRALDEMTAREAASGAAPPPTTASGLTLRDSIIEKLELTLSDTPSDPAPDPSPAKTAARAAARRARMKGNRAAPREVDPLSDVLVLDADADAGANLCTLLERFGFNAYSVRTLEKATEHSTLRPYAAIFLDMALDDAGLAFLERVHKLPAPPGKSAPAVFMVAASVDPADRVRAALAGIASPLIKPLTRGIVARALEDGGVTLPADARRV